MSDWGDVVFLALAVATPFALAGVTALFFRRVVGRGNTGMAALVLGNGLVLATLLSVLFLGFEGYYRIALDTTDGDASTRLSRRWFERHWQRNQMGFRDNVQYQLSRGERRRITFLGDSFTAAHGVSDVEERFVNRIRAAAPDWDVHSIAVMGSSTKSQLTAVRRLAQRGYDVDVVVLAYCFNDLEPFAQEDLEPFYLAMKVPPPVLLAPLIEHSYFASGLFYYYKVWRTTTLFDDTNYFEIIEDAYRGEAWQAQRILLRELKQTVESNGGRLLAVTFPLLVHLGRGEAEDHVMHAMLDALWRELAVPHLDLLPLLSEHKGPDIVVSRFDDHPSPLAHRLAADAILAFLEENGVRP